MRFGKQDYFCPNCGTHRYNEEIIKSRPQGLCCDAECTMEFEKKYVRCIMGKDNLVDDPKLPSCLCGRVGCNSCEPQGR